jgi:tetratricopeptide (TPR) repeat protein
MEQFALPRIGTTIPLHLSLDPWWDALTLIAYGRCDDGLPPEQTPECDEDERLEYLLAAPLEGPVIGFRLQQPWDVNPESLESDEVWDGPRFDVPVLGLTRATIGEILLAVRARYEPGEATDDALQFHAAIEAGDPKEAAPLFKCALEAGDMKAMFGLGYTLLDLGRADEAYQYLRRYTELVPQNSWAWCWLGQACEARGEMGEARQAYERAVELEENEDGSFETDAGERLQMLGD